jgi:cell division protein FtsL
MNTRIIAIIGSIALVFVIAFGLFQVKYKVDNLAKDLLDIQQQLAYENKTLHILEAEWAYLNRPERLTALVSKYLDLQPITYAQVERMGGETKQIVANTNQEQDNRETNTNYPVMHNHPMKPIFTSLKKR